MATYDFTDSWTNEFFVKDGSNYEFTQFDYASAITEAQNTAATNASGDNGFLAPSAGNEHGSDLQSSFGSNYGDGFDLLNFVDFDFDNNGTSDWDAMNDILGDEKK